MSIPSLLRCILAILGLTLPLSVLVAQEPSEPIAADTSSPRDTLRSFIDSCNALATILEKNQYLDRSDPDANILAMRILDCLDLTELPAFAREERAGEVAVCIKEILDREQLPPWDQVPDVAQVEARPGVEALAHWRIPGTRLTIARIEEGPRKHEYLFSRGTVARAVDYHHNIAAQPYRADGPPTSPGLFAWYMNSPRDPFIAAVVTRLPSWLRDQQTFGMTNWKWLGLLVGTIVAALILIASFWLFARTSSRARERGLLLYWLTLAFPVAVALTPLGLSHFVEFDLALRGFVLYVVNFTSILVSLLAGAVVIFALSTRVAETIIRAPTRELRGIDAQLVRILAKISAATGAVALILYGGQYLGIPVATLLASAGIGGVAIALGSQDTLKDLFGTLSLMADKPFRVGDRIIVNNFDGVVEDIGLRATRIRLLTGHLVTLPNDQLAHNDVENVSHRPYIRRKAEIHLPATLSADKIELARSIVRQHLENHEGMDPNLPPRVYVDEFDRGTIRLLFLYWYTPAEYWDFKAFGDRLNLLILQDFESNGLQLAPVQRQILSNDDGAPDPFTVRVAPDDSRVPTNE
ncbi:Low conductance mechanosensitive channel YnaI [Planctomycetes bacterium Pan216]|uniref:Low conductance mechanosensitive channel YnaI n=1 Tax=Kolteria novifilia TaxID=2527975 RepID=A0A518B7B8_9BACT|nr:Low conductance mechanosensitive channel YnaI [Planctomycetes bacterium Pan216]